MEQHHILVLGPKIIARGYWLEFNQLPSLLQKGAIEPVPQHSLAASFYSWYFMVPKTLAGPKCLHWILENPDDHIAGHSTTSAQWCWDDNSGSTGCLLPSYNSSGPPAVFEIYSGKQPFPVQGLLLDFPQSPEFHRDSGGSGQNPSQNIFITLVFSEPLPPSESH